MSKITKEKPDGTYYGYELINMNMTYPWNGSIIIPIKFNTDKLYRLQSSGVFRISNGRQYNPVRVTQ